MKPTGGPCSICSGRCLGGGYLAHRRTFIIALDALFAAYPDARIIWTHRDPAVVMPSVASLTGYIRSTTSGPIDEPRYGREWTAFEELVLHRGLAVREQIGGHNERFFDVHYLDLMADPVGTVFGILDHFGVDSGTACAGAVEQFLAENPQTGNSVHVHPPPDSVMGL